MSPAERQRIRYARAAERDVLYLSAMMHAELSLEYIRAGQMPLAIEELEAGQRAADRADRIAP